MPVAGPPSPLNATKYVKWTLDRSTNTPSVPLGTTDGEFTCLPNCLESKFHYIPDRSILREHANTHTYIFIIHTLWGFSCSLYC